MENVFILLMKKFFIFGLIGMSFFIIASEYDKAFYLVIGVILMEVCCLVGWGGLSFLKFIGFLGRKTGNKKFKDLKLSEIDKEKYENYYKEILEVNSPLILSFLDNFELDKKALAAELLYLQSKEIINFSENQIVLFSENIETIQIKGLERYLVDKIKQNGILKIEKEKVTEFILHAAEELGLIKRVNHIGKSKKDFVSFMHLGVMCVIDILLSIILGVFLSPEVVGKYLMYVNGIIICSLVFNRFFYHEYELQNLNIPYVRTHKGEILNEKIEGLKNYIKEYSLLSERHADEIKLWDEYLIYSVMFGQNKKIVEEYTKYLEIKEEKVDV